MRSSQVGTLGPPKTFSCSCYSEEDLARRSKSSGASCSRSSTLAFRLLRAAEILDGPSQSVFDADRGHPTKQFSSQADIRLSLPRIIGRQW